MADQVKRRGRPRKKVEWPADRVERRSVEELIPYARNARTHSDIQVSQIAASIKEWGWTNPVLVDEAGTIIAGHGRVLAAQKLGISEIPVMTAEGWTDAQRKAYVLADNQLALNADWDMDLLKVELAELEGLDYEIDLIGFDGDFLANLLNEPTEGITDPDDVPEAPEDPISVVGDTWILGNHRIRCGDSTNPNDVDAVLGSVRPHLMVTDPPYGVEYDPSWRNERDTKRGMKIAIAQGKVENDDKADWRDAYALFPGDVAYVWHDGMAADVVTSGLRDCGFSLRAQIIWAKHGFPIGRGDYHTQHEPCFYAVKEGKKGHWNGDRKQSTLWKIDGWTFGAGKRDKSDKATGHGTQKPVECMKRPIENNSSPGQAIYEPFSGSGTTIIAAEMTGRHCYAIEVNPAYVDVAIKRWQEFTGKQAIHEQSGQPFDERPNSHNSLRVQDHATT